MFGNIFKSASLYVPRRYAGHSKWANIKHVKALKDGQKNILFNRLFQRMKVAIKEGGSSNPDNNLQLAQAIEAAKKQSMPSSSIQSCIKSVEIDKSNMQSFWFEVKGPSGSFLIIQTLTVNQKHTRNTIAPLLRKHKAVFADRACRHLFHQKGEIIAIPPSDLGNVEEAVVDHAIECGAEEVVPDENEEGAYKFICELSLLNKVNTKLQELKYTVRSADFNFIPTMKVELTDDDMELVSKLMDKLEGHPEVVALYDNIA